MVLTDFDGVVEAGSSIGTSIFWFDSNIHDVGVWPWKTWWLVKLWQAW